MHTCICTNRAHTKTHLNTHACSHADTREIYSRTLDISLPAQLCLACVQTPDRRLVRTACMALCEMLKRTETVPVASVWLQQTGQLLLAKTLHAALDTAPMDLVRRLALVLLEILGQTGRVGLTWLEASLAEHPLAENRLAEPFQVIMDAARRQEVRPWVEALTAAAVKARAAHM